MSASDNTLMSNRIRNRILQELRKIKVVENYISINENIRFSITDLSNTPETEKYCLSENVSMNP